MNRDPSRGPLVSVKAFAIPLTTRNICAFVDYAHPEERAESYLSKFLIFREVVPSWLPPGVHRIGTVLVPVPGPEGTRACMSVIISTNITEKDMELAKNREVIDDCKMILGITTEPAWYFYARGQ